MHRDQLTLLAGFGRAYEQGLLCVGVFAFVEQTEWAHPGWQALEHLDHWGLHLWWGM